MRMVTLGAAPCTPQAHGLALAPCTALLSSDRFSKGKKSCLEISEYELHFWYVLVRIQIFSSRCFIISDSSYQRPVSLKTLSQFRKKLWQHQGSMVTGTYILLETKLSQSTPDGYYFLKKMSTLILYLTYTLESRALDTQSLIPALPQSSSELGMPQNLSGPHHLECGVLTHWLCSFLPAPKYSNLLILKVSFREQKAGQAYCCYQAISDIDTTPSYLGILL